MQHLPTRIACAALALLFLAPAIGRQEAVARQTPTPVLQAAAVAVADKYSAQAADQILSEGGNAVDAAVAVAFTLAVTYPEAGNIGGGGFMTLYFDGKPYFLDYREVAPAAATRTMYLDDKGDVVPGLSLVGDLAVGVPGTVAGLAAAHKKFGRLGWAQVLAPALRYAHDGFEVDLGLTERRDSRLGTFKDKTNFSQYFGRLATGQTFRQPELEATLRRIAEQGPKDFYEGRTAELLLAEMARGKGLITAADLKAYRVAWRTPVMADWNGYRIITAPPPSSGGVGLVQLLKMKEDLKDEFRGVSLNSPQYIHLLAEIEKRVFADRAEYLGDPAFYKVPVAKLISDAYLARRAKEVNPRAPSDTQSVKPGLQEGVSTTHFSIVDKWGNAVSNTYTLNDRFGSGVVVEGAGFLLNDEMDDFVSKPGVPNLYGLVGKDANAIAPGKHPLSSMSPTILTRNGKVALVIGTPGGSRIFPSVFQVITDLYDFHLPLDQAVAAMRVQHQLLPPNVIYQEPYKKPDAALAAALKERGYTLADQSFNGDIESVEVLGTAPFAVADPRARGVTRIVQ
jgi:gamma-glutamyltranspeptidase/glutathione hydrolase